MHITILALGSHGDVLPFAVLGKGLLDAGHQVRLVTFESFYEMVVARGLELFPISGDAQALMGSSGGMALAASGSNVLRSLKGMMASFGSLTDEYIRTFSNPALRETDLIINQLPVFGDDLCEYIGAPYFNASVIPLARTREFPIPLFPQWKLGPVYNAMSYWFAEQLAWQPFRKAINRWRQEVLDLPPKSFSGDFSYQSVQTPFLAGFSPTVVPRPQDWGPNIHLTGYWFEPHDPDWQPPEEVHNFLSDGPAPVFIGFGSMPIPNPAQVTRVVISALEQSGQRGILSTGWGHLGKEDLPASMIQVGYLPYSWLLPRVAGAVIHGGSGSTGAVLRAGIPTLIVPFVMDQFYWGKRVFQLGVGPQPIPFKQLNVQNLSGALDEMVSNPALKQRAFALRKKIQAEDGIRKAINIIEKYSVR